MSNGNTRHDAATRFVADACSKITILIGVLGLANWLFAYVTEKMLLPGFASVDTAMGLLLAGLALMLVAEEDARPSWWRVAWACAALVMLLGLLRIGEYLSASNLSIDQLIRDLSEGTSAQPVRMGLSVAFCFVLTGVALLLLDERARPVEWLTEVFVVVGFFFALVALIGDVYDVPNLLALTSKAQMSLPTALGLVVLGIGLLTARPRRPLMAVLASPGAGGVMARRMAVQWIPALLFLGWLLLMGQRAGVYDTPFGTSLMVLVSVTVFCVISWSTARKLNRMEAAQVAAQIAAQKAERAADIQLRITLRSIRDAVIATGTSGEVTFMNAAAEKLTGWEETQAKGLALTEVVQMVDEHTRAAVENPVTKVILQGGEDQVSRTRLIPRDTWWKPLTIEHSGAPICDEANNLTGAVLVFRDITARKEGEEARQKLEYIFNHAGWAVIVANGATNKLEMVNSAFAAMHGYTVGELTGTSVLDIFAPESREMHKRIFEADEAGDHLYEAIHCKKDGVRFPVLSHVATFRAENGTVRYRAATFTDLTAVKRVEDELRYQLDLTRTITDNTQSCLWMIDSEGRTTFANPATERITGFKPDELIGRILHDKVPPAHADASRFPKDDCPLDRLLPLQKSVVGYEGVFVHKDGHLYPVRCNGRPIFKEGRPVGMVIEVEDVTEEKRLLESERKARQQAEVANKMKDDFLATLSHELRTPLSTVLGWTLMLRSENLPPDKVVKAIDAIERNARAQSRLVEDLLDVSRIVAGKLEVQMLPVAPAKVVEAAVASAQHMAQTKGVSLQVVLDSRPCTISGDAGRLQQVVWNLVSNAVKFTPEGGSVLVRLERVESHIEISVSDTGEGIAPEFLPHVFERFTQADSSLHRKHGGLGLGLAIVLNLVKLHGGEVRVESAGVGKGASFTVELPVVTVRKEAVHREARFGFAQNATRLDGVKVLLVDDEPDARALLIEMLAEHGAEPRAAANMTEALNVLNEWRPDVLVSDIAMPGGSGYELIRQVRMRDDAESQIPAVALTAYARAEDRIRALSAGFQMHVPKPVEPTELVTVIASLSRPTSRTVGHS